MGDAEAIQTLTRPPFEQWGTALEDNLEWASKLTGDLGSLRAEARRDVRSLELQAPATGGVADSDAALQDEPETSVKPLVVTGHQPDFWHPGIRVKVLLAGILAGQYHGRPLDIVVDTDDVGRLGFRAPVGGSDVSQREVTLAEYPPGTPYVSAHLPGAADLARFRSAGVDALSTLPMRGPLEGFARFCDALEVSTVAGDDLGAVMTRARHAVDPASARGVAVRLSDQVRTPSFRRFAAMIFGDAESFARIYNDALAAYRLATGTRSVAQPVPDMARFGERVEVPFWVLEDGRRTVASIARGMLYADDRVVCALGGSQDAACAALASEGVLLAPKALALTMFERVCVADLFIHGTGGGRYDSVTDVMIRGYFGIEPPGFVVASMTAHAPLGLDVAPGASVAEIDQKLHRLKHNPDSVAAADASELGSAVDVLHELAREKERLVAAIGQPDADRKALGLRIKELNTGMHRLLAPVTDALAVERTQAERREHARAVITDRTYPYFLYDLDALDHALA